MKDFLNRLGAITDVTGDQPHPSVVLAGRLCAGSLGISSVDEAVSQSSAKENEQLWPRNRTLVQTTALACGAANHPIVTIKA